MSWTPRTIKDQDAQYPYRYELKDPVSGGVIATYDIEPAFGEVTQEMTPIDAAYLQPIEDYLKYVDDNIAVIFSEISQVQQDMQTKAPLQNPTLVNPSANTVAITSNNASLATTAAVKAYLDSLMAAYRG